MTRALFWPSLICLSLSLSVARPAAADIGADTTAWAQAQARSLWRDPQWLNLGHYHAGLWPEHWHSDAEQTDFFLSADGASDPRAEMQATLAAFAAPADQGDAHAQCRFPARLAWLRSRLDLGSLPQPDCAAWHVFRDQVQATHATLVFPSYYLNSPSSMFGHTLLRLDDHASDQGSPYLSYAVNFGAVVDASDNGMFYAFKGLTGGYPGQFEVDHYFKKIQEYNRGENRDIWEYPLDLKPDEIERLIAHVWELKDVRFAYYFFDKNCSYRVLELLQVARPDLDLTSAFPLTAIPIDTVRETERAALVTGKQQRPSQGTVLKRRLADIPADLHPLVFALSQSDAALDAPELQALPPAMRARVIEAAYKYLRYMQTNQARDPDIARRSFRLLQVLQAHADQLQHDDDPVDPADDAPDLSHGSRRLALGLSRDAEQNYLTLGLRLSLHSLQENRSGFPLGAQINLGNLDLRVSEHGKLDLNRLDLVDIVSLSPRNRFFHPLSWAVRTGIDRQWVDDRDHRVAYVDGGVGAAQTLFAGSLLYALATARLEYNHGYGDPLQPGVGLRSGLLFGLGPVTVLAELGAEQFASGDTRLRAELRQNLQLSRNQALNLTLSWREQRPDDGLMVGLRYQFYY